MNIGIVTTWFERGAAYVSRAYMDILSEEHNVFIYARGGEEYAIGNPKWDLPTVTWGKRLENKPYTFIDWNEFVAWIDNNKIEVIIFNEQQDWDVLIKCQARDVKIGAYIDYYTDRTVEFFEIYDFLLCNTRRHYEVFKSHPQSFYIPWGTNIELFRPMRIDIRENRNHLVFFHSCGVNPIRKGTELLVDAFTKIPEDVELIIHSQYEISKKSRSLIRKINNDKRISIIEKEVGAPGLYYLGDVYVYPTILEGIGLTIAEALACGLPVITTDEPPMNEFVVDGLNGKLVDVSSYYKRFDNYYWNESYCDIDSLISCIRYYIDNENKLTFFQNNARDFAVENLNWKKNAKILLDILPDVKRKDRVEIKDLIQKIEDFEENRINKYSNPIMKVYLTIEKKLKPTKFYKLIKLYRKTKRFLGNLLRPYQKSD